MELNRRTLHIRSFLMDSGGHTWRICPPNQHQYNSSGCLSLLTEQPDPPPTLADSSIRQSFLPSDWHSLLVITTVAQLFHPLDCLFNWCAHVLIDQTSFIMQMMIGPINGFASLSHRYFASRSICARYERLSAAGWYRKVSIALTWHH